MPDAPRTQIRQRLVQLHAMQDAEAEEVQARHGARITCHRGCSGCCIDGLQVWSVEADRIEHEAAEVLDSPPGPEGACAFLAPDGACRIYAQRPYVCRTQGLPLRWVEQVEGERVEYRDLCVLNEPGGPPPEDLPVEACWTLGPHEEVLARLEALWTDDRPSRVPLRSLFRPARRIEGA